CRIAPIESKDYPTKTERPFCSVLNKRKIKETFGLKIPHWYKSLAKCIERENNLQLSFIANK
ncbi:MAG: NAD(P)-dependent oxidoreductase, partial [Porphyromonadaceae bacterium]|nr:NAD(P)-dependent oxidoreductase [Porphyromonadaceae bacterium]